MQADGAREGERPMDASTAYMTDAAFRQTLVDRRQAVEGEIARAGHTRHLDRLLSDVTAALARADEGRLGLCETCHEPIETDRLLSDPLVRFCLDHLTPTEQRALERDLELAARIQRGLLPPADARVGPWAISFEYAPASVVSGDYCDYLETDAGELFFMTGDVSGKGVAASMLMAHLRATLRMLVHMNLPINEVLTRASSLFCESALPAQYATLVLGRATRDGVVDIANAGHPAPLLIRRERVDRVDSTGLPLGMFHEEQFQISRWTLSPGETLVLYTDGVADAEDERGRIYGDERLSLVAARSRELEPSELVRACVQDVLAFQAGAKRQDDITVAALRRL
jgi:sigma-B regulation protein RsbU (phosphoserine phosphatase)